MTNDKKITKYVVKKALEEMERLAKEIIEKDKELMEMLADD